MKQIATKGIVLNRVNFGEADRILTVLTPDHGKLRLIAKGVRRVKSKLAGGIELFSVSEISFARGRGDIGMLVSTRLVSHYRHIAQDINRTMLGYEIIKQLNQATEDEPEPDYFELLKQVFAALDDADIDLPLIQLWFQAQLLRLAGHTPNLQSDASGNKLQAEQAYQFDYDHMAFAFSPRSTFRAEHIKFLRLAFSSNSLTVLQKVQGSAALADALQTLVYTAARTYLRIS